MDNSNGHARLSAKRKFEIYLECKQKDANVGEILRRHSLHLDDLREIERRVEAAAIEALKTRAKNGDAKPTAEETLEVAELKAELEGRTQALADVATELTILKKSERSASRGLFAAFTSRGKGDGR